jgi:tripartite-type tricarboxylate transporter receptor subunit TctC
MVAGALADPYPSHPVRIVVGTAPGGGPDVLARFLADRLSGVFAQPFVVENKSGANGNIAGDFVARSKPDGHTLLLVPDSVITINPHVYGKNMPFDTLKQLVPVASVVTSQFFLTVNPGIPAKRYRNSFTTPATPIRRCVTRRPV